MLSGRNLILLLLSLALLVVVSPTAAASRGLRAYFADHPVRIDGMAREWAGSWRSLNHTLRGAKPAASDLQAEVMLAHDNAHLYVVARVRDDQMIGGGDRVELWMGIPGGKTFGLFLYPGVVGKSAASVKTSRGRRVRGARIVEAPTEDGYTIEAQIPWTAMPRHRTVRVGFRGAVFVHDADRSRAAETVIGTTDTRRYASLPPLSTEPELALGNGLLREQGVTEAPAYNLMADVVGDALQERVLVYGRYLVVLGPGYRGGREYFYRDLGVSSAGGQLPKFELRDMTGDGKADMVLKRRVKVSDGLVTVFEVLSYHGGGDTPERVFSQEIALENAEGAIRNALSFSGRRSRRGILVKAGRARGLSSRSGLASGSRTGASALLLPWGSVSERQFWWRGSNFVLGKEKTGRRARSSRRQARPAPRAAEGSRRARTPPSRAPQKALTHSGSTRRPNPARVYAQYKRSKNVSGRPRFDFRADLAGDSRRERLVVHGLDLVAFGKGFRGGRGYAAVTLPGLEDPMALQRVKLQDVSGDGKQEVVITAWMRARLPEDVGPGHMVRSVVMIFKLQRGHWVRIFAAELGRRIGRRRVEANIALGKGRIVLQPGRAVDYQEKTYPWRQRSEAADGFEPLLLPWGGIARRELRFDGQRFVRSD